MEGIPKTGRVGEDEENARQTTRNNASFQETTSSKTFAQRKHMHWRTQTLVRNTAGQEGALRHRTTHRTPGSTPPR